MNNSFFPKSPRLLPEPIQGITDRSITYDHAGRVKFQGTYWSARLYQPSQQLIIAPGDFVSIIAIQGITLLVVPTGLE
jgi:membrane protein implicated in regulation of membrane protease activity